MRALLRADRADDELARALARAGLYVERVTELPPGVDLRDVAVVDPRLMAGREHLLPALSSRGPSKGSASSPEPSLEELCYEKLSQLLDRLGGERLPALHETVLAQVERALLRVSLERTGALATAAELLGIHRNTLARRLDVLGLRSRDRKSR